jgi:excinuclease ABC subunit A
VHKLIEVLQRLVEAGNSVLIIEHNLDIIKVADWIIDLGPEGGDRGGELVIEGTPEELCKSKASYTGQFLCAHLHPD